MKSKHAIGVLGLVTTLAMGCADGHDAAGPIELQVPNGKADAVTCTDVNVGLGETKAVTFEAAVFHVAFRVEGKGKAQLRVENADGVAHGQLATASGFHLEVGPRSVDVMNRGTGSLAGELCVESYVPPVDRAVMAAAHENLNRIAAEIDDRNHLEKYRLTGTPAERFLVALFVEYAEEPAQLTARLKALASLIFDHAPSLAPPSDDLRTPFHGLDAQGFRTFGDVHDAVWDHHVGVAGSKVGVRPFSVCETKYILDQYAKVHRAYDGYETYKAGFDVYAEWCAPEDLTHWYNFRGLGHLRPSWVESNIMERVLRRMVGMCRGPQGEWEEAECAEWAAGRRAYREKKNIELVSRFFYYGEDGQEAHFANPNHDTVLLEDRNGDGVGEFLRPGKTTLPSGELVDLILASEGKFGGELRVRGPDGLERSVAARDLVAEHAVDPAFDPAWGSRPDHGLLARFADGTGCTGVERVSPTSCPLLQRFYVLIDRHEDFYSTFSALQPECKGRSHCLSSQPSPLVASSVTFDAARGWAFAGTPPGGVAGLVFLMRIPFEDILVGSTKNVSTLDPPPAVTTIQSLYEQGKPLDFSKLWVDIASLSNDLYQGENEISKFGGVPAEEIEGIIVLGRPALFDAAEGADGGGSGDGGDDAGMNPGVGDGGGVGDAGVP